MDGVIYHGNRIIPHVKEFMRWLEDNGKDFLFLTNSPERSPRELAQKLERMGLHVGEEHFYTSALATAEFLSTQSPGCSAFVLGDNGITDDRRWTTVYGRAVAGYRLVDLWSRRLRSVIVTSAVALVDLWSRSLVDCGAKAKPLRSMKKHPKKASKRYRKSPFS